MSEHREYTGPSSRILNCWWMRYGLMGLGALSTSVGILGMVLPILPSTIFFIIALWAFSKSSIRMHVWLYSHPKFGKTLRAWHTHRVISVKAKILAVSSMAVSVLIVSVFVANSWVLPLMISAILAPIAAFIVTRESHAPSV